MLVNVYKHLEYRPALLDAIENRRALPGTRFTLRRLAENCGLQASFVTNVFKGRFDFSSDQLFAVASELGFGALERQYLGLLLDYARSAHKARRSELKLEIDRLRQENQRTEKHLSAKPVQLSAVGQAEYYLDPFVQLAHVLLSLTPYGRHPERMGQALGLSQVHLGKILEVLVRIGYVRREGTAYEVIGRNKHLPKDNPLCNPHQALLRLKSIDQMQRLAPEQAYSFSATITGTEETREALREAWMIFLKKAEGLVKDARSEKAYQINFDLFPWEL